jgi:hypothetical protein
MSTINNYDIRRINYTRNPYELKSILYSISKILYTFVESK